MTSGSPTAVVQRPMLAAAPLKIGGTVWFKVGALNAVVAGSVDSFPRTLNVKKARWFTTAANLSVQTQPTSLNSLFAVQQ
jgi:hypothetical protein